MLMNSQLTTKTWLIYLNTGTTYRPNYAERIPHIAPRSPKRRGNEMAQKAISPSVHHAGEPPSVGGVV